MVISDVYRGIPLFFIVRYVFNIVTSTYIIIFFLGGGKCLNMCSTGRGNLLCNSPLLIFKIMFRNITVFTCTWVGGGVVLFSKLMIFVWGGQINMGRSVCTSI